MQWRAFKGVSDFVFFGDAAGDAAAGESSLWRVLRLLTDESAAFRLLCSRFVRSSFMFWTVHWSLPITFLHLLPSFSRVQMFCYCTIHSLSNLFWKLQCFSNLLLCAVTTQTIRIIHFLYLISFWRKFECFTFSFASLITWYHYFQEQKNLLTFPPRTTAPVAFFANCFTRAILEEQKDKVRSDIKNIAKGIYRNLFRINNDRPLRGN